MCAAVAGRGSRGGSHTVRERAKCVAILLQHCTGALTRTGYLRAPAQSILTNTGAARQVHSADPLHSHRWWCLWPSGCWP